MRRHRFLKAIAIGTKIGKLTIVKELRYGYRTERLRRLGYRERRYRCRCECGAIVTRFAAVLRNKRTKNKACTAQCGVRKPLGSAALTALLCRYRQDAKRSGRVWELTNEQAITLFRSPCFYCGVAPSQIHLPYAGSNGGYTYNGIDRKKNDIGYVPSNCVAACHIHNWMKGKMDAKAFIAACRAVARHMR